MAAFFLLFISKALATETYICDYYNEVYECKILTEQTSSARFQVEESEIDYYLNELTRQKDLEFESHQDQAKDF